MDRTSGFAGVIGPTWRESTPWWPPEPTPPAGAPNVVLVVLDDVGFAQLGCYGSDIATPNIDGLAAGGVRLANFHTTALCSPTRSCLLTGRNHHRNGMGRVADLAVGYPGILGPHPARERLPLRDPRRARLRAVRRRQVAPHPRGRDPHGRAARVVAARPGLRPLVRLPRRRDPPVRAVALSRQPQRRPAAVDRRRLPPHRRPRRPRDRVPRRPARGRRRATVLPLLRDRRVPLTASRARRVDRAVPRPVRRRLGRVAGADLRAAEGDGPPARREPQLSPRPSWVPAWDDLKVDDQRVAARFMECFAGYLAHADEQIGRVLSFIDELGELDDTLVILVSDNGASSEGGVKGSINDGRCGTAWRPGAASCAPASTSSAARPRTTTTRGAGRWRATRRSSAGSARCTRAASPTRASCAGPTASAPATRSAISSRTPSTSRRRCSSSSASRRPSRSAVSSRRRSTGTSFAYLLDDADAAGRHDTQYFEMLGSRGIYHDGWKAVTFKPLGHMYDDGLDPDAPFDDDVWELYHVAEDLSECDDLAAAHPEKLQELVDLWWRAGRGVTTCCRSTTGRSPRSSTRARAARRPAAATPTSRTAPRARRRRRQRAQPLAHDHRVRRHRRRGRSRRRAARARLGARRLQLLRARRVPPLRAQRRRASSGTGSRRRAPSRPARTSWRSSASTRATSAAPAACSSTARWSAKDRSRTSRRRGSRSPVGGLTCGYELGPAVGTGYEAPFRFNATLHRVVVDVERRSDRSGSRVRRDHVGAVITVATSIHVLRAFFA